METSGFPSSVGYIVRATNPHEPQIVDVIDHQGNIIATRHPDGNIVHHGTTLFRGFTTIALTEYDTHQQNHTPTPGAPPGQSARTKAQQLREQGRHREAALWERGAEGEEIVAAHLEEASTDTGWLILHDITYGTRGANIDHLAVTHHGIFTINSKHHRGRDITVTGTGVTVGKRRTPYLSKMKHERAAVLERLTKALPPHTWPPPLYVTGIIAIHTGTKGDVQREISAHGGHHFHVCAADELTTYMAQQPLRYTSDQLGRLITAVNNPDTWTPRPSKGKKKTTEAKPSARPLLETREP